MRTLALGQLTFALFGASAIPAYAQGPSTAGFPVEPAPPSGSVAPPAQTAPTTPAPAPSPPAPAPSAAPDAPAPAPAPAGAAPATTAPSPGTPPAGSSVPPASTAPATAATAPVRVAPPPPASPSGPLFPNQGPSFGPPPDDAAALRVNPRAEISFETKPGWAVGVDVFGGLGAVMGTDTRGSYALAGATGRVRYRYYELGGFWEGTDAPSSAAGSFTHFGGLLGAWLPYRNWVDFELAARVGARTYRDESSRFGTGGYELGGATLGFQFGVSDRSHGERLGARFGAQLVGSYDLEQHDPTWTSVLTDDGEEVVQQGTAHVGGFTLGIQVSVGLEFGKGP